MGLFNKNPKGGVMDDIRCDEKDYLIWKWRPEGADLGESNRENTIRWGSSIRVKQGSVAVFVYSGKDGFVQDYIMGPADTIVDTNNLPIIANLISLAFNGGSPFQAEVYFINLAATIQTKFAVPYFDVYDSELKEYSVPIAARGSFDFNITDYLQFVSCHRLDDFTVEELQAQVKDATQECIKSIVANAPITYGIPVIQIESKIRDIKNEALETLRQKFYEDYGINLKDINFAGLEVNKDSEGYQELKAVTKDLTGDTLKAKAKIGIKDMEAEHKLGVFGKAANMIVDIRENAYARRKKTQTEYSEAYENQMAGRVGAAGSKIASAFGKKGKAEAVDSNGSTPPPIPVTAYHVVMYGQSAGPYDMATLAEMARNGSLTASTMVWKKGMSNWVEAGSQQDLQALFTSGNAEPELPPIPTDTNQNQ